MKIAVCNNSYKETEIIISLIENYYENKSLSVSIYRFVNGESLLSEFEAGVYFNVIFIGIERNGAVGIEFAFQLRDQNFKGELVLLSSTADFAIDGYDLGAVGYLCKPYRELMFRKIMDRIENSFEDETYLIKQRSNILKIPFKNIVYVESNNSKCTVHTSSGVNYTLYKRLNEIESELSDKRFLRCHRSYLVNMNCIAGADKEFLLKSGEKILIRQKSLKEIKNKFLEFASHNI